MERSSKGHELPVIRIGDYITLRHQKPNDGWLTSEGLLSDECVVSKYHEQFENSLWQVHIQGQYSAWQEYEEALENHKAMLLHESLGNKDKFSNELEQPVSHIRRRNNKSKEALSQMMKAAVNERRLNEKLMQMKLGKAICFGDIVQLRHVKSGKYLTVSDHVLAKQERENLLVSLQERGNVLSYMVFVPKFKYDREGQTISDTSEAFIRVHDRQGEFIHGAKKTKAHSNVVEVNCSLESSSFYISIYQQYREISSKSILAGQLISLQEPESAGYLTVDRRTPGLSERAKVVVSHQYQLTSVTESNIGTNLLWLIEKENFAEGGRIAFKNHRVTLRDLNSWLYLKHEADRLVAVKDKSDATSFELHSALSSDSSILQKNSSIQLSSNGRWISLVNVAVSEKSKLGVECNMAATDRTRAVSFVLNSSSQHKYGTDLFVGVQAMISLRKFEQIGSKLDRSDGRAHNPELLADVNLQIKGVFTTLSHLQSFLSYSNLKSSLALSESFEDQNVNQVSKDVLIKRKIMIREQGLLDALIELLELASKNVFDPIRSLTLSSPSERASKAGILNKVPSSPRFSPPSILKKRASQESFPHSNKSSTGSLQTAAEMTYVSPNAKSSSIRDDVIASNVDDGGGMGDIELKPPMRDRRVTLLSKVTDMATGNHMKMQRDDSSSSQPNGGSSMLFRRENDGNVGNPPKQLSTRTSFFGGKPLISAPNNGHMNFHPIEADDNDNEEDGDEAGDTISSFPASSSAVVNVQSAIRTLGRRASSLFTGGLNPGVLAKKPSTSSDGNNQDGYPQHYQDDHREEKSTVSYELCEACLQVLYEAIRDDHVNQSIVADRFPLLLNLAKNQVMAVKCIQELLYDNLHILQTKVRQREIDMFVQLLIESEMNVTYLRLLQNACSSPAGVDSIQRMVAMAIFGHLVTTNSSSLTTLPSSRMMQSPREQQVSNIGLINAETKEPMDTISFMKHNSKLLTLEFSCMDSEFVESTWPYAHIYFDTDVRNFEPDVRGLSLYSKGLQKVLVSWERHATSTYSMMKLFSSADPISLDLICASLQIHHEATPKIKPGELSRLKATRPGMTSSRALNRKQHHTSHPNISRKNLMKNTPMNGYVPLTSSQQLSVKKVEVAEYLVQQLYIVADVCLDRNYVAMKILENTYDYDMLISILKSSLSNKIKAPAARIIHNLHIDRHPQEASRYPRLIRLTSGDEFTMLHDTVDRSSFRVFHSGAPNRFGILQEVISEYLHDDLDTCKCDAYSVEMTHILHSLLEFGFYTSQAQIQDVIGPLIETLDDHRSISTRREIYDDTMMVSDNDIGHIRTVDQSPNYFHRMKRWATNSYIAKEIRRRSSHVNVSTATKVIPISDDSLNSNSNHRESRADSSHSFSSHSSLVVPDKSTKSLSIEFRYIRFIESAIGMTITLCVVMSTIVVVFFQLFSSSDSIRFDIFNYCVSSFFFVDIALRMFCFYRIHETLLRFFMDPFNSLDTILVVIDFILIGVLSSQHSSVASAGRVLRGLRAIRLLRLIRAGSLVRSIAAKKGKRPWILPKRYSSTTAFEAKTVANIIRILSMIYRRIQNRHIGVIIKAFKLWAGTQEIQTSSPSNRHDDDIHAYQKGITGYEVYQQLLISENSISSIIPASFDEVLKDIVMYNDPTLVEEALHLLMIHKNHHQLLLNIASQVHVIFTKPFEESFRSVSSMLRKLKQLTEMYEIWQGLSSEEDRNTAAEVLSIVHRLEELLLIPNYDNTVVIKFPYLIDEEIQIILRNLDGMNSFMFVLETFYDGGRDVPSKPVAHIMKEMMRLICWFVKGSSCNQAEAFKYFDWFVSRIDDNIDSSSVLREILRENRELIKQCPRRYIAEFAKKIVTIGHRPEYLDMFVGMTADAMVDMKHNSSAVENEIAKFITGREWKQHILLWCSAPKTSEYHQRREAMEKFSLSREHDQHNDADRNVHHHDNDNDLPSDLLYHVKLLSILSGCNLGPKLQATYPIDDILYALLDSATILSVKKGLAKLLIGSISSGLDSARYSEYLWKLLDKMLPFIESCTEDLSSDMSDDSTPSRQIVDRGEWFEICVDIISTVFQDFDLINFNDINSSDEDFKYSRRSENDIKATISQLFVALHILYETHSVVLGEYLVGKVVIALSNLSQHCDNLPVDVESFQDSYSNNHHNRRRRTIHGHAKMMKATDSDESRYRTLYASFIKNLRHEMDRLVLSSDSINMFESIPSQFDTTVDCDIRIEPFLHKITSHIRSRLVTTTNSRSIESQSIETSSWIIQTLRQILEKHLSYTININIIPSILADVADTDNIKVRYFRDIYNKHGVVHLCMDFIAVGIEPSLSNDAMKLLVAMLMKSGGCQSIQQSIYSYLKESDSVLFFDYIKDAIDHVHNWIIDDVQRSALNQDDDDDDDEDEDRDGYDDKGRRSSSDSSSNSVNSHRKSDLPNMIVFFFLQLICEGEFAGNKNFLREQSKNSRIVSIFDSLSSLIDFLSRHSNSRCCKMSVIVLRTVLKLLSGPCKGNQDQLILHTELLVSLNRFMRVSRPQTKNKIRPTFQSMFMSIKSKNQMNYREKPSNMIKKSASSSSLSSSFKDLWQQAYTSYLPLSQDDDDQVLEELKEMVVDVLRTAIECQPKTSVVFERVTTTIEFNVLNLLLLPPESKYLLSSATTSYDSTVISTKNSSSISLSAASESDEHKSMMSMIDFQSSHITASGMFKLSELQSKYLIFTETLGYHRSNLPEFAHDKILKEIVCIEVIWKNEVHRVHFHILDLCRELSDVSKAKVTADIDIMSHELKLKEFTRRSRSLFKEAEHQHYLQSIGLSNIWGIKTRLTRLMFFNAVIMNFLILTFLGTGGYGSAYDAASGGHRKLATLTSAYPIIDLVSRGIQRLLVDDHASGTEYQTGHEPLVFDDVASVALTVLNIIQIIMAAVTVILLFIGQVPVTFSIHKDNGKNLVQSLIATSMDPLPVWYIGYLIITIFGILYNRLWLSAILLDWIVLDSTTRDVLLAVQYPARQLFATLIIILIFVYIFAALYFNFYRADSIYFNIFDMWEAFKLSMAYGIRGEYGVSHELTYTLGNRLVLDLAFYFIILAILRHIFFAIIVDTFGKLRELKFERDMEANNTCFVCGVERHDYDKLSHQGSNYAFADHRTVTHNPLNYLFFMMHIWKQPVDDDNGIEIHVRKCIASGNVSWFPIGVVTDTRVDESSSSNPQHRDSLIGSSMSWDIPRVSSPYHSYDNDASSSSMTGHNPMHQGRESFTSNDNSGMAFQHIRNADHNNTPGDNDMVGRLNAIQKQLSTLSDTMGHNARSSFTANSRQQSMLYNSNSFERERVSERFRLSTIFPRISETIAENEDDDDNVVMPGAETMDHANDAVALTNSLNEVMRAIGGLSRSVQEISTRLMIIEDDRSNSSPNKRTSASTGPYNSPLTSSSAPTLLGSMSTPSMSSMPTSKPIYADPSSIIKAKVDSDIKPPSSMVKQKSISSIKSVSEEGSEDDSTVDTVPIEAVNAKIEAMRSNPFLNRSLDMRLRPLSPQASSSSLQSLARTSTIRQQNRESIIGPSKELIGISPKKDDAHASSRMFPPDNDLNDTP